MYVNIYMYIHIFTYVSIYTCMYISTYIYVYMYVYIFFYVYMYIDQKVHTYTYIYTYMYIYMCCYIYIHMCICRKNIYMYSLNPKKKPKRNVSSSYKEIEREKERGIQSSRKRQLVTVKSNPNSCKLGVCVRVRRGGEEGTANKK